jgi:hypothetical protein
MFTREAVLKSGGYVVESALGNDAAKKALEAGSDYHLFILGHAGSQEERQENGALSTREVPESQSAGTQSAPRFPSAGCRLQRNPQWAGEVARGCRRSIRRESRNADGRVAPGASLSRFRPSCEASTRLSATSRRVWIAVRGIEGLNREQRRPLTEPHLDFRNL